MSTKVEALDATIQKTIDLLKDVSSEFAWPDERRGQAYSALRSVLHAMRDRLHVTEAANFAAQLPMLVRGFYYEGWKPESVPKKYNREQFLNEVHRNFALSVDGGTEALVQGVLRVLSRHVEAGVIDKIQLSLPADLRSLFDQAA